MRTGPDLLNIGARQPSVDWHLLHLYNPRAVVEGSICHACCTQFWTRKRLLQHARHFGKEGCTLRVLRQDRRSPASSTAADSQSLLPWGLQIAWNPGREDSSESLQNRTVEVDEVELASVLFADHPGNQGLLFGTEGTPKHAHGAYGPARLASALPSFFSLQIVLASHRLVVSISHGAPEDAP